MKTKRNLPISKSLLGCISLMCLLVLPQLGPQSRSAKPPAKSNPVFCVQFQDGAGDLISPADALQSDGAGPYCSSRVTGGTQAHIDSNGQLFFASGDPGTSGRWANVDLTDCIGGTDGSDLPPPGPYQVTLWTTASTRSSGLEDLDSPDFPLNSPRPVGLIVKVLVPFLEQPNWREQTEWFVRFGDVRAEECDPKWPCTEGAFAWVTKTDANTWILQAPADEVCLLEAAKIKGGKTALTLRGRISFPFTLTLTRE